MTSPDKIWEIIRNKGNISGTWRHWRSFNVFFSDEPVFLTIHEHTFDYTVRLIVFSKPQKWGWGNLQIFKISDHWKLDNAKDKVVEMESGLIHMERGYRDIPVLDFVNYKDFDILIRAHDYETLDEQYKSFLSRSLWENNLLVSWDEASDYLKPFDIVRINRSGGLYKHVGVYLGRNQICHFAGSSNSGSSGSDSSSMKVKKDTLKNFFGEDRKCLINIIRPVVPFRSKERLIEYIAKTIASEYGKNCYDQNTNNCEHFAFMIVLGINYSNQGIGLSPFTSQSKGASLRREIRDCDRVMENLLSSSNSRVQELVREIRDLTQENNQTSYGDWEARVQVNKTNLNNFWCKIQ